MSVLTSAQPNDDAVLNALRVAIGDRKATVLDLGGGTGGYAVPLAAQGHRVEVLDHSNDALATLARRAHAENVDQLVSARNADLDALEGAIAPGSADLVLCHRVLELVQSPEATLRSAVQAIAPGGLLSVVVTNRAGAVLSRVIAGRFDEAGAALDGDDAQSGRRFDATALHELLGTLGMHVLQTRGVGLIGELNPSAAGTPAARTLAERLATDPVLAYAAPMLHIIARRNEHGA